MLRTTAVLFLSLLPLVAQQATERKKGDIFRSEIDAALARADAIATADRPQRKPLGGDALATNAKFLLVMANCHRRYHVSDGPVVRPTLDAVLAQQGKDGGFGDAQTSALVADALGAIDPTGLADVRASLDGWLAQHGKPASPWQARLLAIRGGGAFPQDVGTAALKQVKAVLADKAGNPATAIDALLELCACQVVNRQMDRQMGREYAPAAATLLPAQERGLDWLFAQQKDGQFGDGKNALALTGIGLMAVQTKPLALRSDAEKKAIETGLRWLLGQQNDDGSFGESLPNYTTCVAVGALRGLDDPKVAPALAKAQRALLAFQNCEQNGYARSDRDYGSIGYGGSTRGDLSNLQFALQALSDTGLPKDHEALQRALVFLQRTQNRRATNDYAGMAPDPDREGVMLDATSGDDGGASYYPGNSTAGYVVRPDGKVEPRSYGSMTYALLKAYTLAGLPADDGRVQAAIAWLQTNWRLDVNPGVDPALGANAPFQGLYYYYLLMAQALDTAGLQTLQVKGKAIDWRQELRGHLAKMQQPDGSWTNTQNGRWMESSPLLCTCYAVMALAR